MIMFLVIISFFLGFFAFYAFSSWIFVSVWDSKKKKNVKTVVLVRKKYSSQIRSRLESRDSRFG